jgi:2,3-bisphosphoglycerate-independent phosphoglycerate mutase
VKYAILIPLGGGDEPDQAPGGVTPLAAARAPTLAELALSGRVALIQTIGRSQDTSGVSGLLGLLDCDPSTNSERRVTEASLAAFGAVESSAWVYSLGWLATTDADGSPSAGDTAIVGEWDESTLSPDESNALWAEIAAAWTAAEPGLSGAVVVERHSDRWILVDRRHDHEAVTSLAPWRPLGESWRSAEPGGGDVDAAWVLRRFMHVGSGVLASHDINASRHERGLPLITMPWPWGGGRPPASVPFSSRFETNGVGIRGVMVTDHELAASLGRALGWEIRRVEPGRSELLGAEAVDALGSCDLVCVCDGGPLRASLADDPGAKTRALESFDHHIVSPVARRLTDFGDPETDAEARGWRLLILPDAIWPTGDPEPLTDPVPALLVGAWIRSVVRRPLTEIGAQDSDLRITSPSGLMEFFLQGGSVKAKATRRRKDDAGTLWELET